MPQRSVIQFSLRGLVAIITGVAIVMGVLSPWIRDFEPGRQQRILTFFLTITAGLMFGLLLLCLLRYRVEQRCGTRHCRLTHKYDSTFSEILAGACFVFVLASNGLSVFSLRDEPVKFFAMSRIMWFMYGALLSSTVTWIWWKRTKCSAELCDNGVIFGLRFLPWSKFKHFLWNVDRGTLSVNTNWGSLKFDVPEEHRAQVSRILELNLHEERTSSKPR
jgi:hypothetical protein